MIVRKDINIKAGLTAEQKEMLNAAMEKEIEFDEDCPMQTDEELREFKRVKKKVPEEVQTVTIGLSPEALAKAQTLGTAVLSKIVEKVLADNEMIKHYM